MTVGTSWARRLRGGLSHTGWRIAAASALLATAVAGCGGGDTVNEFSPDRLIVFGDESSLLTMEGRKYSVNGLDEAGAIDCNARQIWVQDVADEHGFEFAECTDDLAGTPQRALMRAALGATVPMVQAQIDTFEASDRFRSSDLVTVFVGQHDLIGLYARATAASECRYEVADPERSGALAREARATGEALARQVNRIARDGDGGRVLFVTVPDQGATPFARQEQADANRPQFGRRDCLSDLTDAFNAGLRFGVVQDGRQVGLVALDEQVELILDDDRFDFENVSQAFCATTVGTTTPPTPLPLTDCTPNTPRVPAAQGDDRDYLWADDLHFGAELHDILGDRANSRVRNNPF